MKPFLSLSQQLPHEQREKTLAFSSDDADEGQFRLQARFRINGE